MCGIAGIISSNPSLITAHRLKMMTDALAHRGPDGEASYIDESGLAGLAHRRLAIIDLSEAAAQPMHFRDRYTIVHNGELYNYLEIKSTLQQKGYHFRTNSDTEVILAAYDQYHTGCLQFFDGMFAFAIWDKQEQTLFAARDRFGEKPFYYCFDEQQFIFASEMKALWAAGIDRSMNEQMLFNYITLGYVQHPSDPGATFYSPVRKLPARNFLLYKPREHQLTLTVYWDLETGTLQQDITLQKATETFAELFTTSVSRRLRSDVPVGTSLSGGLDSSAVLATIHASGAARAGFKTFSATFPGFEKDESAFIGSMVQSFHVENYQVQPTADDLTGDFEKLCYHQEEPFQSSGNMAQYKVFALAKQHRVTVLLDGQGADEILGGYHKYYHWYWQELFRHQRSLLPLELQAARALGVNATWDWKNKVAALFPSYAAAYLMRTRAKQQRRQPALTRAFVDSFGTSHYTTPHLDSLNGVLYYNTCMNGLEELLQYADRNSMAHGRELRLPFLSHELVQFLFTLPAAFKIKDGWTKWLLRKTMEKQLPANIVWRKDKTGFETPQRQWMQTPLWQQYTRDAQQVLVKKGILKEQALTKKIQPLDSHAADNYDWRYLVAGTLLRQIDF